ncbi:hypothetical protein I203_106521 [Kwoniella mangroviensis CBS 8507]|uniref:uncharacterized protein n=1 Tax=Kwoniella mangroviensis CBS 8507 TaxID=1296122 RepID=UPI00080CF832|nr:uncharacterized protein I203_06983 [Kwoniella mangroviensis CBS 8507]OCF64026.1 hypothetical protein I203_06983 [Kwoniella mangroviensis CBS 8507]
MSALIGTFVTHISQCFLTSSSDNLVTSLPLSSEHPFFGPLRQALSTVSESSISQQSVTQQLGFVGNDIEDNLASFLSAVLKNVRGEQIVSENEAAYGDFSRLQSVYSEANKLYGMTNDDGTHIHAFMNPLIINLARTLVKVSNNAAALSTLPLRHPKSSRSIRDATRQVIERCMQISNTSMTESDWNFNCTQQHMVGDIVWELGNILFRIYAERKLHSQSAELSRTLESLTPHEQKRFASRDEIVASTTICQSYYWRGKIRLILLDFRQSKYWLDKAWSIVPKDQNGWKQRRAILIRLIAVNILVGQLPHPQTLQEYDLLKFLPLIHAYKTGNIPLWSKTMDEDREWYRRRSIWLILYERGEILVWRNLFRNTLKMYYSLDPTAPKNKCPTWIFVSSVYRTFLGSGEIEDGQVELEDVICVLSSLIDHGLIRGILSYSQRQLVMKPAPDGLGGFPSISTVEPRKIQIVGQ